LAKQAGLEPRSKFVVCSLHAHGRLYMPSIEMTDKPIEKEIVNSGTKQIGEFHKITLKAIDNLLQKLDNAGLERVQEMVEERLSEFPIEAYIPSSERKTSRSKHSYTGSYGFGKSNLSRR
jgi:hypothetical protein